MTRGNFVNGAGYLIAGLKLLAHPRLRWFAVVPILVNIVLFIVLTTVLVQQFGNIIDALMGWLPDWLNFLAWIVAIVLALFIVLIYGYSFSVITNLIAAPFYGLLAEKAEEVITGNKIEGERLIDLIPRTFARELTKLWYFIVRGILMLLLLFVPLIGPLLGFVWSAWCMSIQYTDYAMDNHRTPFPLMRQHLRKRLFSTYGFGALVMAGTMVPILNILIMPAAVVGGTFYWVEEVAE